MSARTSIEWAANALLRSAHKLLMLLPVRTIGFGPNSYELWVFYSGLLLTNRRVQRWEWWRNGLSRPARPPLAHESKESMK